jgi:hypothetical protein
LAGGLGDLPRHGDLHDAVLHRGHEPDERKRSEQHRDHGAKHDRNPLHRHLSG